MKLSALFLLIPLSILMLTSSVFAKEKPRVSKIGIHLLVKYTPGAKKIIESNCPIIKLVDVSSDMMSALKDYRALHPKGIVILRIYTANKYPFSTDPKVAAKDYWDKQLWPSLSRLTDQQKKWIDYLEGTNEGDTCPTWGTVEDAKWYNDFWVELSTFMHDHGFKPCIGSIAVGNPPGNPSEVEAKIRAFVPALTAAKKFGGAWCYHSYSLKHSTDPELELWYSLRYRQYYKMFAKFAPELSGLPLLLTEGGIDSDGTHPQCPGWKRDTAEKYEAWLTWFDSEIKKDSYVKGITLFEIGHPDGWNSFDLEPISDWLANYLKQ